MSEYVRTIGQIRDKVQAKVPAAPSALTRPYSQMNESTESVPEDHVEQLEIEGPARMISERRSKLAAYRKASRAVGQADNGNEQQNPYQFDRILKDLRQTKKEQEIEQLDKEWEQVDMESVASETARSESTADNSTTSSKQLALQAAQKEAKRIEAKMRQRRLRVESEDRRVIIQRLKRWSLLLFCLAIFLLVLRSFTGIGANCKLDQTWSVYFQQCLCDEPWAENKKGNCVAKCTHNRLYNLTTGKCLACPQSWQHVEANNTCTNRCTGNLVWFDSENECGDCPNFWQWVVKDNLCVDRCTGGKSFNRYEESEDDQCIDMYDLFNDVAETNFMLIDHKDTNTLGGSLAEELECGADTLAIPTPYSEKSINLTGYQFVDFISSLDPALSYYERTRMFLSKRDFRRIDLIIDTEDNESNQCYKNKNACWLELTKFHHKDDIYFVREGFSSDNQNNLLVEGQWRFGEQDALIRLTNPKGATLTWRSENEFHGKSFEINEGETLCQKQIFRNNEVEKKYEGNDMTTPF